MREIIFRGKRKENGKWIAGFIVMGKFSKRENDELIYYTRPVIIPMGQIGEAEYEEDGHYYREIVIPETVGQYTGLERTKRECEAFFRSEMFYGLTDLDGETIMNRVQRSV